MKGKEAAAAARRRVAELEAEVARVRSDIETRLSAAAAIRHAEVAEVDRRHAAEVRALREQIEAGTSRRVDELLNENLRLRAQLKDRQDDTATIKKRWESVTNRLLDHAMEAHKQTVVEAWEWLLKLSGLDNAKMVSDDLQMRMLQKARDAGLEGTPEGEEVRRRIEALQRTRGDRR